jgi:predicted acylesterase/phospholipase RssA
MERGIACAAGSYKGVFVHGVLDAFERAGLKADMYAASSSSTVCAAYAAAGCIQKLGGAAYWKHAWAAYIECAYDISTAVLRVIDELIPFASDALFKPGAARFAVAVSAVITKEAQEITQGTGARKLGQKLVLATRTKDRSWAEQHLQPILFDSMSQDHRYRLRPENLRDVAYATTRMLHAWKAPAWVEGMACVDASYTCTCPAVELAELGCHEVIAISPECGVVYRDFFQSEVIPQEVDRVPIRIVQPSQELSDLGVDYLKATGEGFTAAYEEGRKAGEEFMATARRRSAGNE